VDFTKPGLSRFGQKFCLKTAMNRTLHIFLFLATNAIHAQTWTWDTVAPAKGTLVKDNSGGYYVAQLYAQTISHVDSLGNHLWDLAFHGDSWVTCLAVGDDNCLYAGGHFLDSVQAGGIVVQTTGDWDGFIAKITFTGGVSWVRAVEGPDMVHLDGLCAIPGRILMTGAYTGEMNFPGLATFSASTVVSEVFVAAIDHQGVFVQAKATTIVSPSIGSNSWGYHIDADAFGNVYLIYNQQDAFFWGQMSINHYGQWVLMKMDPALNALWTTTINPYGADHPFRLRVTKSGEPIVLKGAHGIPSYISTVEKYSTSGGLQATFSTVQLPFSRTAPANFTKQCYFFAFDVDSCDNSYYSGLIMMKDTGVVGLFDHVEFQLSPGFQLTWMRTDTLAYGPVVAQPFDISAEGVNRCFISGWTGTPICLHDTILPYDYFARLQTIFSAPVPLSSSSPTACANSNAVLQATAGGLVSWYPSLSASIPLSTGMTFTVPSLPPGTYTYYADASTCSMTTGRSPVQFTILPSPAISANSGTICKGTTFTFSPAGALSYTFPAGTPVFTPQSSGLYSITGIDALGCTGTGTAYITLLQPPFVNILGLNRLCAGVQQTLVASGAQSYTWNNGVTSPSCVVASAMTSIYSVKGKGPNGCSAEMEITVSVDDCTGFIGYEDLTSGVYPNPFIDHFEVVSSTAATFEIIDAMGKVWRAGDLVAGKNEIGDEALARGLLLLKVRHVNGTIQAVKLIHR
jgi:hypothetical protein